ncbi:hypothetical protein B0H14DRAFT_2618391 [Mycena olivaceomarginata]|nr:hypothetical protein B0H14DRAFT_2618391 [Mycena olivaceomarginata]
MAPALPSDDPNQIYDDFAGELAQNRPSPNESSEFDSSDDEDAYNTWQKPEIDDIMPEEHPESDGLLYQYDDQFAEEQRSKISVSTRIYPQEMRIGGAGVAKRSASSISCLGFHEPVFSEKELNATRCMNFANPLIRPKLHLYPEDSSQRLEEARQAAKWKQEVDGNISGPMARGTGGKDFFVEEVCFAKLDSHGSVGPVMPMRWFTREGRMWSIAHPLRLTASNSAFVIDGRESTCLEIPLDKYFLNVRDLEDPDVQARYSIPPPSSIAGILRDPSLPLEKWSQPSVNQWRIKGKGRRWNKHNSILFTLAGLPRELTQMIYNIHFIATSNLSPPLEMMEAVVAMLREAQKDGIEVWDCEYQDWILIIPWFLAFQGDNPMSSEFASHVGMKGKFFCRVCKAKSDKNGRAPGDAGEIDRLKEFMTASCFRRIIGTSCGIQTQGRAEERGPSGTGVSKAEEVKNLLHKLRAEMPDNIFNPVLSIPVKYWWRDAVSRQNSKGKEELRAHLSSVDVSGLNTPPIRGKYLRAICGIPDHLPTYLETLEAAVFDFMTATALWNTQWFNKPKFHLFVHLTDHIRRFGPLILYATESFESFNLVIRLRSIHSSKHAPSLDIATAFSHLHAVRHLVSGGYVLEDENGNHIAPRQAGPEVLALLNDEEFLGYMSMTGLSNTNKSGLHMPLVGSAPCPWPDTAAAKHGISSLLRASDTVQRCRSLVLTNGDKIEISKYLIYRKGGGLCVGQAEEILVELETDSVIGILISACLIGPDVMPYRLPSCTLQENQRLMVAFNCKMTLTRRVVQERQRTDRFENEVNHAVEPNDCFLNLAQLRSATDVQHFRSRTRFPEIDREQSAAGAGGQGGGGNKGGIERSSQREARKGEGEAEEKGQPRGGPTT